MSKGHHFTRCQYCNREYACGDCITNNCELGRDKRSCQHYQNHIRQQRAEACQLLEMAKNTSKTSEQRGARRLLAGLRWGNVCNELNNAELAEALKQKVWATMEIGTEEMALMEQAIDRLEAKNQPQQ